jgi:hypothetical protein
MRSGFLGSITALLAGAGLALGQSAETLPAPRTLPAATPAAPAVSLSGPMAPPAVEGLSAGWADLTGGILGKDRLWFSGEYLMWIIKNDMLPPLATTTPRETDVLARGILGRRDTLILLGHDNPPDEEKTSERFGGRFSLGYWLDDCKETGAEATFFFLGRREQPVQLGPDDRLLARPFSDVATVLEDSLLIEFPGLVRGAIRVDRPSELWGAEANFIKNLHKGWCYNDWHLDFLAGFRFLSLEEELNIGDVRTYLSPLSRVIRRLFPNFSTLAGDTFVDEDHFATENHFYGGQVGLDFSYSNGIFTVELLGKVAAGGVDEMVDIAGSQVLIKPGGATTVSRGGLLALASNSGRVERGEFAVVPQLDVSGGVRLTNWCGLYVGYSIIYWSDVVRPADQVDRELDTSEIPNFPHPSAPTGLRSPHNPFKSAEFFAQGVNLGVEFHW